MSRRNHLLNLAFLIAIFSFIACQQRAKQPAAPQQVQQKESQTIPDFKMNSIGGSEVSILEEIKKSKITVIDFWASWCGPCIMEAPNMVKLYNDYHAKGLNIVGISLDKDSEAWHHAIEEKHMVWTQLSDLQGWDNAAARLFGISSIPFTIVVDAQGHVLTAGLRGQELQVFIANKLQ